MALAGVTSLLITYRYWILFPVACVEGPFLSFIVGTLAGAGYFNPFLAYPILLAGDLIPDTVLVMLGRRGNRAQLIAKYGPKIGLTEARFSVVERLWREHPRKMMLMSKLALGLASPLLISAGLSGIDLGIFYSIAIPVALVQHLILLSLGYHFATSYGAAQAYFGKAQFIVGVIALFGILYFAFAAYMKRRFLQEEKTDPL